VTLATPTCEIKTVSKTEDPESDPMDRLFYLDELHPPIDNPSCGVSGEKWNILVFEHQVGLNAHNQRNVSPQEHQIPKTLNA